MAALLIVSDLGPATDLAGTTLGASLAGAGSVRWTTDPADAVVATVIVDHDAALVPGALDLVLATLDAHPDVDAFAADAVIADVVALRPAWSPTRLAADPAALDLLVVRGAHPTGGLTGRLQTLLGIDDTRIGHLPAVLVEHRTAPTADHTSRAAAERALDARRSGPSASSISVVIPTAGFADGAGRPHVHAAIDAARRSGADDLQIVLVVGDEFDGDPAALVDTDVELVHRPPGAWNFSTTVNLGLVATRHDHVLVLNDDVEALADDWLLPMAEHLRDPGVGAVGALLVYPDHRIQHAGMVVDDAVPLHGFVGLSIDDPAAHVATTPREVAAVTGACLLARRADLLDVGGLNEALPFNFNDVDLCFKLLRSGKRVVVEPASRLVHHEGASRDPVTQGWEWDRFVHRWGQVVDPWYHPAYVRPDDPDDRRRNADHLLPPTVPAPGELRTATIISTVHEARLRGHEPESGPE